jgi:hypothetical protein
VRSKSFLRLTQLLSEGARIPIQCTVSVLGAHTHLLPSLIPFFPSRQSPWGKPLRPKPIQLPPRQLQSKGWCLERPPLQSPKPDRAPLPRQVGQNHKRSQARAEGTQQ